MKIGGWIVFALTVLPGPCLGALGVAPDFAAPSLAVEAEWVRGVFVFTGLVTGFFAVRAVVRELVRAKDDKEARFRRAPFVATALLLVALSLLVVAVGGEGALTGSSAGALRVLLGLYGVWIALFALPMFFARKLDKVQPLPVTPPNACGTCGTPIVPGTPACAYCGANLA